MAVPSHCVWEQPGGETLRVGGRGGVRDVVDISLIRFPSEMTTQVQLSSSGPDENVASAASSQAQMLPRSLQDVTR